jgi:hypothetical protein
MRGDEVIQFHRHFRRVETELATAAGRNLMHGATGTEPVDEFNG